MFRQKSKRDGDHPPRTDLRFSSAHCWCSSLHKRLVAAALKLPNHFVMGRSSKNKRKHQQQQQQQGGKSKRQRKQQRFWILDCQDTSTARKKDDDEEDAADIEILVTRIELSDDYKRFLPPDQDKTIVDEIDSGSTESGIVTGGCETTKASVEAQIEDHDVPIHSLTPYMGQRSVVDLENQKDLDAKNSASVKVAIRKSTSAKRPILKVRLFLFVHCLVICSTLNLSFATYPTLVRRLCRRFQESPQW